MQKEVQWARDGMPGSDSGDTIGHKYIHPRKNWLNYE